MGFLRKMAGMLGFTKDDGHEVKDNGEEDEDDNQAQNRANFQETGLPRKGFSVPVQVAVDRNLPGPVLVPCRSGDGGVQVNHLSLSISLKTFISIDELNCWISIRLIYNVCPKVEVCVSRVLFMNNW